MKVYKYYKLLIVVLIICLVGCVKNSGVNKINQLAQKIKQYNNIYDFNSADGMISFNLMTNDLNKILIEEVFQKLDIKCDSFDITSMIKEPKEMLDSSNNKYLCSILAIDGIDPFQAVQFLIAASKK